MSEVAEFAREAEGIGFEHLTVLDDLNLTRDVYAMLSVAAMATSRIKIGTGVTHPYVRHPVQTAVAIASINELSRGRAFLGLGAGALYPLLGMKNGSLKDVREALLIARGLSRGEPVELPNGTVVEAPWIDAEYPIYLASDGPGTMQLAGELADATWIMGLQPELVNWRFNMIERGLEKSGRSRDSLDIWLRCMVVMADTKEEARNLARVQAATHAHQFIIAILHRDTEATRLIKSRLPQSLLDDYARLWEAWDYSEHESFNASHAAAVSDDLVDAYTITGTPEDCAEILSGVFARGFDGVSVTAFTHRDKVGFWQAFMDDVVPSIRT